MSCSGNLHSDRFLSSVRRRADRLQRRGTTLIEMASVMVLMAMLMLLSLRALTAAGRLQEMSLAAATEIRLWQYAEQRVRNDLARARSATVDGQQQFTLQIDATHSIRYRVSGPQKIAREVIELDAAQQPQIVGRDALHFSSPVGLRMDQLSPELVRVTLELKTDRQIVALLGQADRFNPLVQPATSDSESKS